jgi:hypothetical protein
MVLNQLTIEIGDMHTNRIWVKRFFNYLQNKYTVRILHQRELQMLHFKLEMELYMVNKLDIQLNILGKIQTISRMNSVEIVF